MVVNYHVRQTLWEQGMMFISSFSDSVSGLDVELIDGFLRE